MYNKYLYWQTLSLSIDDLIIYWYKLLTPPPSFLHTNKQSIDFTVFLLLLEHGINQSAASTGAVKINDLLYYILIL